MSHDEQTRPRWTTRPTTLRWRRHGLAGGIAAGLLVAGGGAGYAAGSAAGGDHRAPAVEQVVPGEGGGTDSGLGGLPAAPPAGFPGTRPEDVPDDAAEPATGTTLPIA